MFAVCIEQSVTIDSFQFAHYGTVIKIDFCRLYLLQQEHCSFCNIVFLSVSSVDLRKREKKHGSPVSPGVYMYSECLWKSEVRRWSE